MNKEDIRVVFMGTPNFAVPSLRQIVESGYRVSGVVTAPDRKAGRGRKLKPSPVKEFALEHGLTALQPEKLREESFLNELKNLKPDIFIVVAFRMLPEAVWSMPALGTFNLHASLLPEYRGAAPINHAIINGEKESGLTTFFIDQEIDTGKIIARRSLSIEEEESFGELHDRMMSEGADLVIETLELIRKNDIQPTDQTNLIKDPSSLKKAPKITKEFCRIDWTRKPGELHNFIRGLSPYPGAFTYLNYPGQEPEYFKILQSGKEEAGHQIPPGVIISDNKSFLKVAVPGGYIHVNELQQSGKRPMGIIDFLNGSQLIEGMKFG